MPRHHVLLIDDDDTTNYLHKRAFTKTGVHVDVAVALDGQEGLDYLQRRFEAGGSMPDLILVDLNMPRMNGFEFLSAYEALPDESRRDVLVVMVSSSMLPEDRERALAFGCVSGFKNKPLTIPDARALLAS